MAKSSIVLPKLMSIAPTSGPAGTFLTIKGSGFVDGNNVQGLFFGGVPTHDFPPEEGDETHDLYRISGSPKATPALVGWSVVDDNTIIAMAPEGADGQPALSGTVAVMLRTEGGSDNFGGAPVESNTVDFTYTA